MSSYLYLGYNSSSSGTYDLSGSGLLSAAPMNTSASGNRQLHAVGRDPFGVLRSVPRLYCGQQRNVQPERQRPALRTLRARRLSGSGTFTQSGGTHSLSSSLYLGYNGGSSGTYNLTGGGLLSAPNEYIGYSGSGGFAQTGGSNSATNLIFPASVVPTLSLAACFR